MIAFSAKIVGYERTAFVYAGSSSYEREGTEAMSEGAAVVFCGAHGPVMKNIFDPSCLADSDYVIFGSEDLVFYTETDSISAEILLFGEENKRISFSYEE